MSKISGPGLSLPSNGPDYPDGIQGISSATSNVAIDLPPGGTWKIPPGEWMIAPGKVSVIQYLDPITGSWLIPNRVAGVATNEYVCSDGQNFRVANLTGCPVGAQVSVGGSAYTAGSTSVTASGAGTNSTWNCLVGGQISVVSIPTAGVGYGIAPLVFIEAPPMGNGVQATATAYLTGGSVTSIGLPNVGAGYTFIPKIKVIPNPYDPNYIAGSVTTNAVISIGTVNTGSISAVYCIGNGAPLSSVTLGAVTLTVAGTSGSGASVVAHYMQTVTSVGIPGAGVSVGTGIGLIGTVGGGAPITSQWNNPNIEHTNFIPRQSSTPATFASSITAIGTIIDSGLFISAPTPIMSFPANSTGGLLTSASLPSVSLFMGSVLDTIVVQRI